MVDIDPKLPPKFEKMGYQDDIKKKLKNLSNKTTEDHAGSVGV